jgi:endonuclease-3
MVKALRTRPVLTAKLIDRLEEEYGTRWWSDNFFPEGVQTDPFKHLIITILSQNTSDTNSIRAYKSLAAQFEVTPHVLVAAPEKDIKKAIKSGGLYNIKAKRIKEVSRAVIDKFDSDVGKILRLPVAEAKQKLTELPGIGPKTADVVLTDTHTYKKVIPIDTHMERIAKRLGLARRNAKYDEIQAAFMRFIPAMRRERASGLLWLMAKHTCKARKPRCLECVLKEICPKIGV